MTPRVWTPTTDAVEALERPGWKHALDPETGEPLYYENGRPVVYPISAEEKITPVIRKWLTIKLWRRMIALSAGVFFLGYVAGQIHLPDGIASLLELAWTFLIRWGVFVGGVLGSATVVYCVYRVIKGAFGR